MAIRLTVFFLIALCLLLGIILTVLPWVRPVGLITDWGDNYLLVYAADKSNFPLLRRAVASGWVRGVVTAIGVLNLMIAFWEMAHFNRTVRALEQSDAQNQQ